MSATQGFVRDVDGLPCESHKVSDQDAWKSASGGDQVEFVRMRTMPTSGSHMSLARKKKKRGGSRVGWRRET
jgi:hypothetical protein